MTQVRALHAHDLAQVVQVVHAAVHNAVVLAVVVLTVHGSSQVIAAFGGVKAAHLHGQVRPAGGLLQGGGQRFGRGEGVGEIVAAKIRYRQAGAVFQF